MPYPSLSSFRAPARYAATATLTIALFSSCAKNPVTGKSELALISESQEIELGRQAAQEVETAIGFVDDAGLQAYVSRVGMELAGASQRPELPWSFQVLDDPTPNAFALPGGPVYVTRGMLTLLDSEAELASVLGHEVGHITSRHAVQQISRAQLAQIGLGVGSVVFPELAELSGLLQPGLQLLMLQHSRDDEREADTLGFDYALQHGYDVREMDDVFATLDRMEQGSGRSPLPTWASTHPTPGSRAEAIQARQARLRGPISDLRLGSAEYLAAIDGLPYGDDPRQGYFDDGTFYHPDLAFQVDFPEGWTTRNLRQAVVAVSPERDAALELVATAGDPETAARRFLAQSGVRGGDVSSRRLNGLPAVVATFQAQSQQGLIEGLATFVAHEGHTYALYGYAAASRFGARQRQLQGALGSFDEVTDPRVLNVQPPRIDIVQLPESMSASEFLRRYPSSGVDDQEVLLMNQIRDEDTVLPAGRRFKRVVQTGRAVSRVGGT